MTSHIVLRRLIGETKREINMKLAQQILALSLGMTLRLAAHAKGTHLGRLSDGDSKSTSGVATKTGPKMFAFSDDATFKLASKSDISDIFTAAAGITRFTVEVPY